MTKDIAPVQSQLNLSIMALVALVAIVGIVALMLNAPVLAGSLDEPALERVYVEQPSGENMAGDMRHQMWVNPFASTDDCSTVKDQNKQHACEVCREEHDLCFRPIFNSCTSC